MQFETWEPTYERILADFGFGRAADERARDVVAELTDPFDDERLAHLTGATVAVVGAAPSLQDELDRVRAADAVVAASTAVDVCREAGIDVDCMVTDLDKNPETVIERSAADRPCAVHAHGDNVPAVREVVPAAAGPALLPTTQAAPTAHVRNFGGFTDGDRAAFLADHFGAAELVFAGWDFDDPNVDPMKAKKLAWAERLLYWLERLRGEQFAVLDGRRESIETDGLPVD